VVERSDTTGYGIEQKAAGTPAGVQEFLVVSFSGGVVADAPQPPATGWDASGIGSIKNCLTCPRSVKIRCCHSFMMCTSRFRYPECTHFLYGGVLVR